MVKKISVIVPTVNEPSLAGTLEALAAQRRPADEVIVVGRDEAGLAAGYTGVKFVDTGRRVCAAAARNRGIEASRGEVIAFTDADCVPGPGWLAAHEEAYRRGERVVGGGVELIGSNYWAQGDNVAIFHDYIHSHPAGYRQLLPTLNLSVHRSVVEAVGGLDESFPGAAAEDCDWTTRMRLAGFRLYFEPRAVVKHAPARTCWRDVVGHSHKIGRSSIRVRLRYADEFGTPAFARRAHWLRILAPLVAAHVTARIYGKRALWAWWRYLPIVYAAKVSYCMGAARAVESGYALEGSHGLSEGGARLDSKSASARRMRT